MRTQRFRGVDLFELREAPGKVEIYDLEKRHMVHEESLELAATAD